MAQDRALRKFLTSWISQPRPHGRPQFTFGNSLNKTLMPAGITTDFKKWTEPLAQDCAGWRVAKLIYQTAQFPPRGHSTEERDTRPRAPGALLYAC